MGFPQYALALIVATGVTFGASKPAHGELVFEDDLNTQVSVSSSDEEEDEVKPRVQERRNITKSEAMRRQRLREELKNEDLLTQKLEELRLRDEMRRTGELLGSGINKPDTKAEQPVQEQAVGSAASEEASAVGANPALTQSAPTNALASAGAAKATNGVNTTMTAEIEAADEKKSDGAHLSIGPRFGTSSVMDSIYDMQAKYSLGADIIVDVSDHVAFTAGYTYATYGIGAGQTLVAYPQQLKTIEVSDNVINIGLRGNLFGVDSRVRPFAGVGFAYRKGYVNYDKQTRDYIRQFNQYGAQDVDITGFAGYVEAGLEFRIVKSVSLTASLRYFNMLSSRQSSQVNPNAFYGGNAYSYPYYGAATTGGYYSPYSYNDGSKERAGQTLSKSNFYQLHAGVTFNF